MNEKSHTLLDILQFRGKSFARIRSFFEERGVMEVHTPLLGETGVSDPHIHSWKAVSPSGVQGYLQTSPEYAMKRLLAAGAPDSYQLTPAFRAEERGRWHHPEFWLCEWYRLGWSLETLCEEVVALIQCFTNASITWQGTYLALFEKYLGVFPHSEQDWQALGRKHGMPECFQEGSEIGDYLLTHVIEPQLTGIVIVMGYPETLAALSRIENGMAQRFEVYLHGIELANGFAELSDPVIQRERFERDNKYRRQRGLPEMALDEALLSALTSGLPDCVGVALGVERLLALAKGLDGIDGVRAL